MVVIDSHRESSDVRQWDGAFNKIIQYSQGLLTSKCYFRVVEFKLIICRKGTLMGGWHQRILYTTSPHYIHSFLEEVFVTPSTNTIPIPTIIPATDPTRGSSYKIYLVDG